MGHPCGRENSQVQAQRTGLGCWGRGALHVKPLEGYNPPRNVACRCPAYSHHHKRVCVLTGAAVLNVSGFQYQPLGF